ncbi:hypothetical protein G3O08_04120 [Cryomorpha ignava]|uniref:Glycosyltransferase family 39 protein n=1 Tax=Cryomorpha ignava TaxID=101383 RepID=A0A7K3WP91_9FLAO|nr:hypothetical protein [Cryomorpha ignava]NEN22692.1 hypothetical protein [Cryomorpha ignava]
MKNVFLQFGLVNSTITAIGIFFLIIIVSVIWKPDDSQNIIRTIDGDGKGYYMYLPSIFISGDFGDEPADYRYLLETPNGVINRYNAGTPILIAPFFAAACTYYEISGLTYSGYESGFQKMANFAALFYFLLGLYAFSLVLRSIHFRSQTIAIVVALLAVGSNLLFYTVNAPAFSHVYSFFSISFLLLFAKRFIASHKTKHFILASIFLGLTLLIRPFNGLIIFAFPFLASNWSEFAKAIKALIKRPFRLFLCVVLVVGIFGIQQILWFVQTGHFVLYGYSNEGFYFDKPQIMNVLFSFRKGLFIYTPILLVTIFGLAPLFKKNRYRFCSYLVFSVLIVYFISSWWIWYYGPSFGHRVFIDFYPLLFIPLAFLIQSLQNRFSKYGFMLIATACVLLNLLQSYQFKAGILSQSDMNWSKYRYVFGTTDAQYENVLGGASDMKPYHRKETIILKALTDFENKESLFRFSKSIYDSLSNSIVADYREYEFNVLAEIPIDSSYVNGRDAFLKLELHLLELQPMPLNEQALIVFDLRDSIGNPYYYIATPLKDVPLFKSNNWQQFVYSLVLPIRKKTDKLSVYIWNKPKKAFYLDNISMEVSVFE